MSARLVHPLSCNIMQSILIVHPTLTCASFNEPAKMSRYFATIVVVIKTNVYLFLCFLSRLVVEIKQFVNCHTSGLASRSSYRLNFVLFYSHACVDVHVFEAFAYAFYAVVLYQFFLLQSVFPCYKLTWLNVRTKQQRMHKLIFTYALWIEVRNFRCFEIVIFSKKYAVKRTNCTIVVYLRKNYFSNEICCLYYI